MGQVIAKLSALQVARLKEPGMYADGAGLYLQVTGDGRDRVTKSWIYRYGVNGRTRDMGLGSVLVIGLAAAREKAAECRRIRDAGKDPIDVRKADRAAAALAAASAMTFKQVREKFIAANRADWRNPKHAAQWETTLERYAEPEIGAVSIQAIDAGLVLKVIEPIWRQIPETASRLRGRIEAIIDFATVHGWRTGENPARWRGHLDKILPAPTKVRAVKHHAALPFDELPAFLADLRNQGGAAARALEFTILTVARTKQTIGAQPSEVSAASKIWTVPGERMKAGKEHRVPLAPRALELAGEAAAGYLFPGPGRDQPLSNMAMTMVLRRMGRDDITVHGFRSTFRDWAAERTNFPSEVVEMALAHAIDDKVEAAYRRGDLLEKRTRLMNAWANFCATAPASKGDNVVRLKASAG
ncbi:MAG: integrase arm-type DNA-binding domain-containing protein [Alphaproteobacteria bacterium]|nr:integrase arm-type DNA-binding domain-containing protein [Alphaproteobacteria bacterium]